MIDSLPSDPRGGITRQAFLRAPRPKGGKEPGSVGASIIAEMVATAYQYVQFDQARISLNFTETSIAEWAITARAQLRDAFADRVSD
jgi:hypothetical protein